MSTLRPPAVARPSKRTPERQERLLSAIRGGATRKAACQYAGISDETFANWSRRYLDFLDAVTRAEAEAEIRMTAIIHQAAPNDWRAAAWWLERRRSSDFGRRERIEVDIRHYAERVAGELGLNVDELLAEAERIVRHGRD